MIEVYYNKNTRLYLQITGWNWGDCVYIIWLVILLKNALSLFISARYSKYNILTNTMWNIIDPNSMSKITDLIEVTFSIPNINLANLTMFLLS